MLSPGPGAGVVKRDAKPGNVMIGDFGDCSFLDVGGSYIDLMNLFGDG